MTLSGLWTRKSSPKGRKPEPPPPPSHVRETPWTQLKSKLRPQSGHGAADRTNPTDATANARPSTDRSTRRFLLQIITPRPSVPAPRRPPTHRPSQDNVPLGNQVLNSRSYRSPPPNSPFTNFVSECENDSFDGLRANTFGEAPSAERCAQTLDIEESPCEHVGVRSSDQHPPVPSSNATEPIETSERPPHELSSTCAPEFVNALPWYEGEVPAECLSSASMAQGHRRRLRAQIRRARLVAEDVANPGFSLDNLSALGWAPPVETDGVAVNHVHESAGVMVGSISAAAPIALDAGLYELSPEPTIQSAPPNEANFIQPSQFHDSFHTETTTFEPISRDSWASSSSSHSVFEYDDRPSNPPSAVENFPPPPNPVEESDVECERSVYDPVLQCFSLPTFSTRGMTSSAEIVDRTVDSGWSESAKAEEESFVPVAPTPSTPVSHPPNDRIVIKITPPSPPVTMRSQYPQRNQSIKDTMANTGSSHLALPNSWRSKSSTKAHRHGFALGGTGILLATRFEDNPSPLTIEGNEDVGPYRMASNWPWKRSISPAVTNSVERGNDAFAASVRRETLPTSRHSASPQMFVSSNTLVDQFLPPAAINTPRTSGMIRNDCLVVDRNHASAADKAEPLSSAAPMLSTPVPFRKARKSKGFAGGRVLNRVHRQAHALGSSIASSFREWGNAASRLLTVQPQPNVASSPPSNPYFDPYSDGYVPPRGLSPDLVQPGGDVLPLQPSIGNVYVKLD